MIFFGVDGNVPSCTGKSEPKEPKEPREPKKLVRIGSRYFSKDTHTYRKLNFGVCVEKTSGGVAFKSSNEVMVDKQTVFNPVNKKLPTYPGEVVRANPPLVEEEKVDLR